jgi:hypothetical protein
MEEYLNKNVGDIVKSNGVIRQLTQRGTWDIIGVDIDVALTALNCKIVDGSLVVPSAELAFGMSLEELKEYINN